VSGRIQDAIRHHSVVLRLVARPIDKAFHATLLILDHRSPEAKPLFEEAIAEIQANDMQTQRQDYILRYCRYYEALISGQEAAEFRVEAEGLPQGDQLRKLLPFPPQGLDT
jgi:hypothetical protein